MYDNQELRQNQMRPNFAENAIDGGFLARGVVGGAMSQMSTKPNSPVEENVRNLQSVLEVLDKDVNTLCQRLDPYTSAVNEAKGELIGRPQSGTSQHSSALSNCAAHAEDLSRRLRSLQARLEL
jgi:hypothetical protein